MGWLENSTAVITGAADGIGRAVALRYLEEGAKGVVVLDRDLEPLSAALDAHPDRLIAVQGDVRDYQDHVTAVELAVQKFGTLDVLVGNAGVYDFRRPLHSYSPDTLTETLDEIFAINLRGNLFAAMAAREALIASKGSMIFTTSVAGIHAGGGGCLYGQQTRNCRNDPPVGGRNGARCSGKRCRPRRHPDKPARKRGIGAANKVDGRCARRSGQTDR